MAKRIYTESVKKWAKGAGITGGTLIGLIFVYLIAIGAITNVSYSGDVVCAGTEEDPCYAYINFTANEDIFIYPTNYDPWGRDTLFAFDPGIKSWKLERKWGNYWWEYDLTKPCDSPRCGAKQTGEPTYALAWRKGKDYQIRITAYKNNPSDDIKWGAFTGVDEIDPNWYGVNKEIGYEFLTNEGNLSNASNGDVVHIWNVKDDYFFEKDSGIQLTNHFQDYWTKNVFCIGYYSGETWNKIYCADELDNFNRNIETDGLTYVNATLWKDIVYQGYDLRLGVQYNLGLEDENLSITIYGKNLGIDIPFDLGFAWKIKDVEIPLGVGGDKIFINNSYFNLDENIDLLFKNMFKIVQGENMTGYDNETKPIYELINETVNISFLKISGNDFLRLDWDENLNYVVKVFGDGNQSNFYTALLINAGHFNPQQEKSTTLYWIDADTGLNSPTDTGEDFNDWTNPTNAFSSDDSRSDSTGSNDEQDYFDFNFGIPVGAIIEGIEVSIEYRGKGQFPGSVTVASELSWDGGTTYTTTGKDDETESESDVTITEGGSSDTWGRSWSSTEFSNANFRYKIKDIGSDVPQLDHIQVKVYYTAEGDFLDNFDTSGEASSPRGIDMNETFFWIVSGTSDDWAKYYINGTYAGETFDFGAVTTNDDPWGIATDGNNLWIGDATDDEVYKYFINGTYFGTSFDTSGESCVPQGIDYYVGNLYVVCDDDNWYKYFINGTYTGTTFDFGAVTDNDAAANFH